MTSASTTVPRIFADDAIHQQLYRDYCKKGGQSEKQFEDLLNWLSSPPKYSTVRFNHLSERDTVILELENELKKQFSGSEPVLDIHPLLKDMLVISSTATDKVAPCVEAKEIYVDVRCGVSVLRGAPIFAPGIVGAPSHLEVGDKVAIYSDLEGKCLKGRVTTFQGNKFFLGNGIMRKSRRDLFNLPNPSGVAVDFIQKMSNTPSLGHIMGPNTFLQNLPSVVCGHVMNPKPNESLLDMCASPGGKTSHLAALINDQGLIVALDKTKNKVDKLKSVVDGQGFQCVKCYTFDSRKSVDINKINEDFIPPFKANTFDKVLLDAPCSALGQRPQLHNKITSNELNSYPRLQRMLISAAVQLVKPGGTLLYSTCTLVMAENEDMVKWALDTFPNLTLDNQTPHLGGVGLKGSELGEEDRLKLQRFDSFSTSSYGPDKDTIGFFIAKFIKQK